MSQTALTEPGKHNRRDCVAVIVGHEGMAVAANAPFSQLDPCYVAACRRKCIPPTFHCRSGVDPKAVLIQIITPKEQVRHVLESPGVAMSGIRSARWLE